MTESVHELPAAETWVDKYGDELFRYAWKRLQDRQMAEDVVQETLLAALDGLAAFRGTSSEKTWLIGILKHKVVDYIRQNSRERPADHGDSSEDLSDTFFDEKGSWSMKPLNWGSDPGEMLTKKQFWQSLQRCLSDLPRRMAHAFALRELEEVEGGEISRIMGISQNNLGVVLHRARLRLRRCLEVNWLS